MSRTNPILNGKYGSNDVFIDEKTVEFLMAFEVPS